MLDISTKPTVNGEEVVLFGTGISFVKDYWYLGILRYSAISNILTANYFDYNSG